MLSKFGTIKIIRILSVFNERIHSFMRCLGITKIYIIVGRFSRSLRMNKPTAFEFLWDIERHERSSDKIEILIGNQRLGRKDFYDEIRYPLCLLKFKKEFNVQYSPKISKEILFPFLTEFWKCWSALAIERRLQCCFRLEISQSVRSVNLQQ